MHRRLLSTLQKLGIPQPPNTEIQQAAGALIHHWQEGCDLNIIAHRSKKRSFDPHTATVIFTHGLGDTGAGWGMSFKEEIAEHLPYIRFVFPTARTQPVTLNQGAPMPSWYDIPSLMDLQRFENDQSEGLEESRAFLEAVAYFEMIALNSFGGFKRVVLGGFSQGGALAMYTTHCSEYPFAGCLSLSGYLAKQKTVAEELPKSQNITTPLFMGHGSQDPMVPLSIGEASFNFLKGLKKGAADVRFQTYPGMGHESCPNEMKDVVETLKRWLPDVPARPTTFEHQSPKL